MKRRLIVGLMLLCAWTTGRIACAGNWRSSCAYDLKRVCPAVPADHYSELLRCLNAEPDSLSKKCLQDIRERKEERDRFKIACANDVARFCAGNERPRSCLRREFEFISQPCGIEVRTFDLRYGVKVAVPREPVPAASHCVFYAKELCSSVREGGEEAIGLCLNSRRRQVSAICRDELDVRAKALDGVEKACAREIGLFCDQEQGVLRCLNKFYGSLGRPCLSMMNDYRRKLKKQPRGGKLK